ncbi:MAG: asparagine--tRNA ligase [Candidatus Parvarchaeota archaeon]|nr:asparagine--tRNA ligase [Candidatus Parvarchaeota archaeon]
MVFIEDVLSADYTGKTVTLRGFANSVRKGKNNIFIMLRDPTGIIQCVSHSGEAPFEEADRITRESSLEVEGTVRQDQRAEGGYELSISRIKIFGIAEPFPLKSGHNKVFLFDNRHLWFRSIRVTSVMKVRSTVFESIHSFFRENGFYEIQSPSFVGSSVEGGATLFSVDYFGRKAFLTQSWQLYAEAMVNSLWKIYTVAPSFRAEKSRTWRHLTEFWHAEAEVAFAGNDDIMDIEEKLIKYIIKGVLEKNRRELQVLKRDTTVLENTLRTPFPRMRYEEVIDLANKNGLKLDYGADLGSDEERVITSKLDVPIFSVNYPKKLKPFYHKPDPNDPSHVLCNDLLAPEGYGEIIGAGQRIDDKDTLIDRIKEEGLNQKDYEWYIDLRRYGSIPHSGFGLGVDRLVMWICKLPHIAYAVPFPRTMRRLFP